MKYYYKYINPDQEWKKENGRLLEAVLKECSKADELLGYQIKYFQKTSMLYADFEQAVQIEGKFIGKDKAICINVDAKDIAFTLAHEYMHAITHSKTGGTLRSYKEESICDKFALMILNRLGFTSERVKTDAEERQRKQATYYQQLAAQQKAEEKRKMMEWWHFRKR